MLTTALLFSLAHAKPAPPEPSYETRELRLNVSGGDLDDLVGDRARFRRAKVVTQGEDGTWSKVSPLRSLPDEALAAVLLALVHNTRGAEQDLMMSLSADGPNLPVTVTWEGKELRVAVGEPLGTRAVPTLTEPELRERYGLGSLVEDNRSWDPRSVELLDMALAKLSADEVALLASMPFKRTEQAPAEQQEALTVAQGVLSAAYATDEFGGRIEVYDDAFVPTSHFVGPVSAPQPLSLMILLHELGHAIVHQPQVQLHAVFGELIDHHNARSDALKSKVTSRNERMDSLSAAELARLDAGFDEEAAALTKQTGLLERLEAARVSPGPSLADQLMELPGARPVTWYAEVSPDEFFAEAFALFHTDPAALQRISPEMHAWFAAGTHLITIREQVERIREARAALE